MSLEHNRGSRGGEEWAPSNCITSMNGSSEVAMILSLEFTTAPVDNKYTDTVGLETVHCVSLVYIPIICLKRGYKDQKDNFKFR